MTEIQTDRAAVGGSKLMYAAGIASLVVLFVALLWSLLFVSGFWSAKAAQPGPETQINVKLIGGRLPGVVVESQEVVVTPMRSPVDPLTIQVGQETGAPNVAAER